MPQGPIPTYVTNQGGTLSNLNVTAAKVVKGAPGRLSRIVVQNAGTSGVLTINDLASTSGAAAGNQLISLTTAQLTSIIAANGGVITLEAPALTGIAVTTISGGIVANVFYS
jgi:hypothetical protein